MFDKNKVYGLSLEGGGFRGSYQAGAICCLLEQGVKIGAVCGTSIGSLNACFVATNEAERLKKLWFTFRLKHIFEIENKEMESVLSFDFKNINLKNLGKELLQTGKQGGLNIDPLLHFLEKEIDEDKVRASDIKLGLVTYNLSELRPEELFIEQIPKGELTNYLMASSYLPGFQRKRLGGKYYVDGGVYNNLPSNMLAEIGYDEIIQIRLHKISRCVKPKRKVNLYNISSKEHLGPVLIYNKEGILRNFENGYRDALELLES